MVIRAIDSILAQTYKNIEIIVVDDSPESFSQRLDVQFLVQARAQNISYILHETNQGACIARNTGLKMAKGEFVAFLDDDDEWMPDKIEKQIQAFDHESVALTYCGRMTINDSSGIKIIDKVSYHQGKVFPELILKNFIGSTSIPLLRKSCIIEVGGFDPMMKSAQDYDVWLRLAEKYLVRFVAEPLVAYHIHEGERISTSPRNRIDGQERIIHKNGEYITGNPKAWWIRHIKLATQYATNKELGKALALWAKAVGKCPNKIKTNLWYLAKIIKEYIWTFKSL